MSIKDYAPIVRCFIYLYGHTLTKLQKYICKYNWCFIDLQRNTQTIERDIKRDRKRRREREKEREKERKREREKERKREREKERKREREKQSDICEYPSESPQGT